jgi:transglutaminase-like putative cysteine protease
VKIKLGFNVRFNLVGPTSAIVLLKVYPGKYRFIQPEFLTVEPNIPREAFIDSFGNEATRMLAPPGPLAFTSDGIVEVDGQADAVDWNAPQHLINDLPVETLRFLFASRYCEVDRLMDFAWATFGGGPTGYQRVQAIVNFVHNHLRFDYQQASPFKSANDAFLQRQGVCRDFAHLSITLCRCMGIPARYATGYLGDIGVPYNPSPMDFSAWFEVYLGGRWFTFDARHNTPRIGRVVMAYGRDATDAALTSTFGPVALQHFEVWTTEVK